jgi:hypothetical protein
MTRAEIRLEILLRSSPPPIDVGGKLQRGPSVFMKDLDSRLRGNERQHPRIRLAPRAGRGRIARSNSGEGRFLKAHAPRKRGIQYSPDHRHVLDRPPSRTMTPHRENEFVYPPPRSEAERGRGTTRSVVEGAPLPPSFACFASCGWSPLPAIAGRDKNRDGLSASG